MAGGNLSPRQKMINLMYLIFIAMLALNMSKEVLSAFGFVNERLTISNKVADQRNHDTMARLDLKATESPEKYDSLRIQAKKVKELSDTYCAYLDSLKTEMVKGVDTTAVNVYETMDKGDFLDNAFFKGEGYRQDGTTFVNNITRYREGVRVLVPSLSDELDKKFNTEDVPNKDNIKVKWLYYHYKGYPLIASVTKMTQIQADVKALEAQLMGSMLDKSLTADASMDNYNTLLRTNKGAYFNGEIFDGDIVLGRADTSTKPDHADLTLDGVKLVKDKDYTFKDGAVKLKVGTGRPGNHKIEGMLVFKQDGEDKNVKVDQTFTTIPRPISATISADKMNVVYRGVKNPMTISFAGISDNNVNASAGGYLKKVKGSSYIMDVTKIKGREVTINVTGKLPDGAAPARDNAKFRVKDLPRPVGTVRGESGSVKMQRNALQKSTIGALFEDFDFKLPLRVKSFKFKVPGQPTIEVKGSKLDGRAQGALRKAKRGSDVTIFDINAKATGVAIKLKKISPIIIELKN